MEGLIALQKLIPEEQVERVPRTAAAQHKQIFMEDRKVEPVRGALEIISEYSNRIHLLREPVDSGHLVRSISLNHGIEDLEEVD